MITEETEIKHIIQDNLTRMRTKHYFIISDKEQVSKFSIIHSCYCIFMSKGKKKLYEFVKDLHPEYVEQVTDDKFSHGLLCLHATHIEDRKTEQQYIFRIMLNRMKSINILRTYVRDDWFRKGFLWNSSVVGIAQINILDNPFTHRKLMQFDDIYTLMNIIGLKMACQPFTFYVELCRLAQNNKNIKILK